MTPSKLTYLALALLISCVATSEDVVVDIGVDDSFDAGDINWQSSVPEVISQAKSRCNIDKRHDLSWKEFNKNYLNKKPVIYFVNETRTRLHRALLHKQRLLSKWAQLPVATTAQAEQAFRMINVTTLQDLLEGPGFHPVDPDRQADEVQYLWSSTFLRSVPELGQNIVTPPDMAKPLFYPNSPHTWEAQTIGIGQPGSGLTWHWHAHVPANEVVYGSKRWWISKDVPPRGANSMQTSLSWLKQVYPLLKDSHFQSGNLWECTLEAGMVMYVPTGFYHQTLNLNEVVSILHVVKGHDEKELSSASFPIGVKASKRQRQQFRSYFRYLGGEHMKQPATLIKAYAKGYERFPTEFGALYSRLLFDNNQISKAVEVARAVLSKNPVDRTAYERLTLALFKKDDFVGAMKAARQTQKLDRNSIETCIVESICLMKLRSLDASKTLAKCERRAVALAKAKSSPSVTLGALMDLAKIYQMQRRKADLSRTVEQLKQVQHQYEFLKDEYKQRVDAFFNRTQASAQKSR